MKKFVYTKENLRRMQNIELEMLRELDSICRKNQISYIIDGGTEDLFHGMMTLMCGCCVKIMKDFARFVKHSYHRITFCRHIRQILDIAGDMQEY